MAWQAWFVAMRPVMLRHVEFRQARLAPVVLGCIRHGSVLYGVVLRGKSRFGRRGKVGQGKVRIGKFWSGGHGKARYGRSVTFSHGAARQGMARHGTVNNQNEMGVTNGSL